MSELEKLTPDEAVAQFRSGNPVFLRMQDACGFMGITFEQLRPFLISGEIAAYSIGTPPRYMLKAQDVLALMARRGMRPPAGHA